jgi:branched-chain amino acid transport system permease protein
MVLHGLISRFVTPFNSLLLTFGLTVIIESFIQWIWTADFVKLQTSYGDKKVAIAGIYLPFTESLAFLLQCLLLL